MAGGFSFCGIDIGTIGLEYAPELEDTYVYRSAKTRIHEETYEAHDGGYYYGSSKEPKEFTLRCIFEEQEIDRGLMAKVISLFREGRSGKLVFDRRPWCWYYATVQELDITGITNFLNGIIKISMKAYYPFARGDLMAVNRNHKDYNRIMANTAYLEKEYMMPPTTLVGDEPIAAPTSFYLFNPGDVYAHVGIEIAGDVGRGVTITNETTGQKCKFVAMSESTFDGENYVYCDGLNGKTTTVIDGESKLNFLYHDEGFIELAPGFPIRRKIQAAAKGGEVITLNKMFDRNAGETPEWLAGQIVGQHIWLGSEWHEISGVGRDEVNLVLNEHILQVADEIEDCGSEMTVITQMNKITIEPVSTMKITRLNFIYLPTFS